MEALQTQLQKAKGEAASSRELLEQSKEEVGELRALCELRQMQLHEANRQIAELQQLQHLSAEEEKREKAEKEQVEQLQREKEEREQAERARREEEEKAERRKREEEEKVERERREEEIRQLMDQIASLQQTVRIRAVTPITSTPTQTCI